MTNVILTAGAASRMGELAPHGCKALVPFRGRPMIEWQLDALGGHARIVCRSPHAELLERYGYVVIDDSLAGAAHALRYATYGLNGPVTVAYADTFFTRVPAGDGWCGVHSAKGGRSWDVVVHDTVYNFHVEAGVDADVCVGLYRFPDARKLRVALGRNAHEGMGLGPAVNQLKLPFVRIPSWQDVGTPESLAAAK